MDIDTLVTEMCDIMGQDTCRVKVSRMNGFAAARYLWLSDQLAISKTLLRSRSDDVIRSVIAHELGHRTQRNQILAILSMVAIAVTTVIVSVFLPLLLPIDYVTWIAAITAAVLALFVVTYRFQIISIRLEHDADRKAIEAVGLESFMTAFEKYYGLETTSMNQIVRKRYAQLKMLNDTRVVPLGR